MPTVIIVGAGQAGAETALALRQQGHAGPIILIGEETHLPYRRPPLSKTYLTGQVGETALLLRDAQAYAAASIDLMLGVAVDAIDRPAREVVLRDGARLRYDALVLATGGQVRKLALAGADAPNLHYLRTIDDARRLRAALAPARRVVVVGGGYVGLEVAASAATSGALAATSGALVTVLESAPRLLARVAEPELSACFAALHRRHGVDIQTGVTVSGFDTAAGAIVAVLSGERRFAADVVVVGIGLVPGTALATAAGLEVADGIVVDQFARSGDPHIYAVGDCARHVHPLLGRSVRLESVPSASDMARAAASAIVGKPKAIGAVPWFWSDQFDVRLQMAGMTDGHDQMVERRLPGASANSGPRPDHDTGTGTGSFSLCYLRAGRLIAVTSVNAAQDFQAARALIAHQCPVTASALSNTATPLRDLLLAVPSAPSAS